ncbi:MAG: hypothetical protein ACI9F9_003173, partial [Candidatus Paceibacteria bacterium]
NLLYLGTEFNGWISIDRGLSWTKIEGMPTVAVHEFAQSPATGEVVVGTHGRSLWAFDATPLRQFTEDNLAQGAHLYTPAKKIRWRSQPTRASSGTRRFVGENPTSDALIWYSLSSRAKEVQLSILGVDGSAIYTFKEPSKKSGLHRMEWNLRANSSGDEPQEGRRRRGGRGVPNGNYTIELRVDGRSFIQSLVIAGDPDFPDMQAGPDEAEEEDEEGEYRVFEYGGDR